MVNKLDIKFLVLPVFSDCIVVIFAIDKLSSGHFLSEFNLRTQPFLDVDKEELLRSKLISF